MKNIMRKILLALGLCVASLSPAGLMAQKVKGSDTLLPFSQKAAEVFMKQQANKTVVITGGGSGVGIAALIERTTDIAQASRAIKFKEKTQIKKAGHKLKEQIVAYDALAVVVNTQNKVSNLTREQLEGIFTGTIKNWSEVGGANLPIVAYSRETSSGTYEFFKSKVLNKKNYKNAIMSLPSNGALVQSVSQTKGAIAYVGLAYLSSSIKAIKVSYDGGKTYVAPSAKNAQNHSYPIVRPLYYYYIERDAKKNAPFLNFVMSKEGQKIVESVGYIPAR